MNGLAGDLLHQVQDLTLYLRLQERLEKAFPDHAGYAKVLALQGSERPTGYLVPELRPWVSVHFDAIRPCEPTAEKAMCYKGRWCQCLTAGFAVTAEEAADRSAGSLIRLIDGRADEALLAMRAVGLGEESPVDPPADEPLLVQAAEPRPS